MGDRLHSEVQRIQAITSPLNRLLCYLLVGGCAAALDFSFFLVFSTWLGFDYLFVGVTGFMFATLLNYWLSIRWVFEGGRRFAKRSEIAVVYAVSLIGLLLHGIILMLAIEAASLPGPVGKVLATGLVFFWNFGARNYYVFNPKS